MASNMTGSKGGKSSGNRNVALLFILTAVILFMGYQSPGTSNGLSNGLTQAVIGFFGRFDRSGYSPREVEKFLRKLAHFSEYLTLATFAYIAFKGKVKSMAALTAGTFLFVLAVALTDELLIQQFLSGGRTFSVYDVVYDMIGAGVGLINIIILKVLGDGKL